MAEVHSTFFHSLIQMSGTILGFALIFVFFAFLSNLFARFAKIKPQNSLLILPDAEGNKEWLSKSAPVLLQISIAGTIGKEDLSLEQIETQLTESKMGDLRKDRVKGILLKIDSPGGSATDSDAIYRRLKAYKAKHGIPIYAYVEGICASGSFLVACASDKIFASPTSIVGSVGVMWMLPFFNVHKVLEKWEIDVKTFSEGKHKDHLNPFRPWHPGEDSDLKNLLSHAYSRFVDLVSKERPKLTQEKLIHEIGAQIYSAPESARLGFIDDGESDYPAALKALAEASGLKNEAYQVVELKKKKAWFKEMMARSPLFTGKMQHELKIGGQSISNESPQIAYLFIH